MVCTPFRSADGQVTGFVCGPRRRMPNCSTPGCRGRAELECDAPVERNRVQDEPLPKRGDARLHRLHNVVFYVHALRQVEGVNHVTISTKQPGCGGALQTVPVTDWLSKTIGTCDKPVCRSCAVRVGELDYCGAHGRRLGKATP